MLLPWRFAAPLACRLLWDQTLQADLSMGDGSPDRWEGVQAQPGDKSQQGSSVCSALRLCWSPHSQRDRCSSLELCPCPIPWGGQTYHSPGVLHPGIIPAVLPARHSPEQGPTPGGDRGTKLQAQQVSHFPSLLSHIQGNVTPLGSFLEKRGSTVAAGMSLPSVS